jgi:hypothetical protein
MPISHLAFSISQVVLRSAGISLSGTLVENFEQGLLTVAKLGYPVVLKVISPDIVHKSNAWCKTPSIFVVTPTTIACSRRSAS